jgi:hypothetical protein
MYCSFTWCLIFHMHIRLYCVQAALFKIYDSLTTRIVIILFFNNFWILIIARLGKILQIVVFCVDYDHGGCQDNAEWALV